MDKLAKFMTGFLLGAAVGALAAILAAPASGDELRSQLRDYSEHVRTEVKDASVAKRIQLENQLEALRAPHIVE